MRDLRAELQTGLGSTYVIDRELGGGGMARVFVATETALHRSIVLKVVAPELLDGLSAERFAREVQLAARLQHPNIVPVLATGDANGLPFYTMPFVRGESLRARLALGPPWAVGEAVAVLRDVARALAYAHGEGIIHRDIKPENVLVSGGAAVVTDFGIAKAIDRARTQDNGLSTVDSLNLTRTGVALGTPAYMAPEQTTVDPHLDQRADLYAWGVMAWELFAGRHPFAGKASLAALVAAHLGEVPAPLTAVRADVPAALSDLIQRCLAKAPADRPASASEVLALLDHALGEGARRAAPAGRRRRTTFIALGVLATIVLVAGLALILSKRPAPGASGVALAIIPFAAQQGDTLGAYLGVGIADGVTNQLKQIGVRLAGSSSAEHFVGQSAKVAGDSLKFPFVLDGRIVPLGADSVTVTGELTRVSDGELRWRDSYRAAANHISAVQDEMVRAIALQLQLRLADGGGERARGTKDDVAYESYLKGLYLYRRRNHIMEAIDAFDQATQRDPKFARAWAALTDALLLGVSYEDLRISTVLRRARDAAERAVRLEPKLADGHVALGYAHAEAFEWAAAEAELDSAIRLDSTAAEPRHRLGTTLLFQGKAEEAIQPLKAAVALDPFYSVAKVFLGSAEATIGSYKEGLDEELRSLALEPNAYGSLAALAWIYARIGNADSAQLFARRMLRGTVGLHRANLGRAAFVLARSGATAQARMITDSLKATPPDAWTRWSALTMAYAGLRDTARMLDAMERAAAGDGDEFPVFAYKLIGELPSSPRVDAVFRRYNLVPHRFTKHASGR